MAELQPGTYNVRVANAGFLRSQNKGTPGIAIRFENDTHDYIEHTMWVTPGTTEFVLRDLDKLGMTEERMNSYEDFAAIGAALKGAECEVVVEDEEYQGNWRPKVKFINAAGDPGDAVSRIYGLLTGRGVPGAPSKPQPAAAMAIADDDLPF